MQQINRTPTRGKVAPSPDHHAINAYQLPNSHNVTAQMFDDFHHSNSVLRSNTNENVGKIFRIRKSKATKVTGSLHNLNNNLNTNCATGDVSDNQAANLRNQKLCNRENEIRNTSTTLSPCASSIFGDEEIVFTENQIYVGINERSTNNNNNINNNGSPPKKLQDKRTITSAIRFDGAGISDTYCECDSRNVNNKTHIGNQVDRNYSERKFIDKEICFEKVGAKKSRDSIKRSCERNNETNNYSHYRSNSNHLFETSADVSFNDSIKSSVSYDYEVDSSPTNRLSECDNLNQIFWLSNNRHSHSNNANNDHRLPQHSSYADSWDFLHNKPEQDDLASSPPPLQNPRMYEIHYEAAVSSRRTSISTVETWIDDETFDNSYNEELEKRCANYR